MISALFGSERRNQSLAHRFAVLEFRHRLAAAADLAPVWIVTVLAESMVVSAAFTALALDHAIACVLEALQRTVNHFVTYLHREPHREG
jgi:hypothetical protein